MEEDQNNHICSFCESEVKEDDDFCPNCGTLFTESVKCIHHFQTEASGVCVICAEPYCGECGLFAADRIFLCNEHSGYEIVEGLARVYGSSDNLQCELVKANLEAEGLHPFVFMRKASPMHLGGIDYSLFRASGDYNGHIINEIKVMVPFQEVIEAEKILIDVK